MPHPPRVIRRTLLAAAGSTLLAAAVAPSASAETLLTGPDAPLIVKGDACVGSECESGTAPSRTFVVRNRDTPIVRMDQTSGGGFVPQIWDVAGNEANFFVRDVTAGNVLAFRIFPGARSNALTVRGDRVGIGTTEPGKGLDMVGSSGTMGVKVTEQSPRVEARTLADLTNRGPVALRLTDSDAQVGWTMGTAVDGTVALTPEGHGALPSLMLSASGDVTAGGTVQQAADPARQRDVEELSAPSIVDAIRALPIERYRLDGDASGVRHLAPNGAAFRAAFGLGASDTLLAPGDVGAVALAGVQALLVEPPASSAELRKLSTRIANHGSRLGDHDSRIGATEHVNHGHERRIRAVEHQATLAETRFRRSNRREHRLSNQVSSLRSENVRLKRRLAAVEAAVARLR